MSLPSGRRKGPRKHARRRKTRVKNGFASPKSPQSILAEVRRKTSSKARNQGGLFATTSNPDANPARNRGSQQSLKYSKFVRLTASTEPLEENCLDREPLRDNYVFVPKGDVYITRHCRTQTKESCRIVYVVYDNAGKRNIGLRVPKDVYAAVLKSAAATADLRAHAVKTRDEKDLSRARQILRNKFPLMPAESLETIVDHAFLKCSGRVGRTTRKTDEQKANLAVEAHIRHTHTPYESLLDAGKARQEAREAVWDMVQAIKAAWEGANAQPTDSLPLRSRDDGERSTNPADDVIWID
ncbi:hypothetical protein CNMCM8980_007482 [Aspergillus fumigatiaffinis]|uniref:DUF2293 domain-containing protein n=1 Tax=Aspergillus fumigatiaffinis TaxID=340414 RepID=A0A8H4MAC5_9EURO|nr:hypothetical protein CNMCM5878_007355 [Aspergillus fumigatiaffinis]KAF4234804.1 hypothetical protein CNMCM6457_003755 [Aspergillus fumigatiaffinis]KAF4235943.1 hypothetical protein CNMCM6805_007731 [Aspergillus fumigatiaffinis]KAF4247303.1 hypothetical protein CNMCM8980_007482 [Aspergillus fumigatiaffinis]